MPTDYQKSLSAMTAAVAKFTAGLGNLTSTQMAALGQYRAGLSGEEAARAEGDAAYEYATIEQRNQDYNADVKESDAKTELTKGEYDARRKRRATIAFRSTQRALYGASGVNLRSASVITVISEQALFDEMDTQAILYNAEVRAITLRNAAQLDRWMGKMALRKGGIQRELAYGRGEALREAGIIGAAALMAGETLGGGYSSITITRDIASWRKFGGRTEAEWQ